MEIGHEKPFLAFLNVSHSFLNPAGGITKAVENLSLSIGQGEIVCVVGPSGCGKSTLLRMAAGLEIPASGEVRYQGSKISGPNQKRGVVFQNYGAFPWLTVKDNVAFGLAGKPKAAINQKVEYWLDLIGLTEFGDSYPKALSGGMRQRLALARTVAVEPELLLLDEPFGALDEPVRRSMQVALANIAIKLKCGVLFVTHDIGEALFLADRVVLMSNHPGRILEIFDVEASRPRTGDFYSTPDFVALYERVISRFPNSLLNP
jgi:NitT/TauT family transport system ATP-binding protein